MALSEVNKSLLVTGLLALLVDLPEAALHTLWLRHSVNKNKSGSFRAVTLPRIRGRSAEIVPRIKIFFFFRLKFFFLSNKNSAVDKVPRILSLPGGGPAH